MRKVLIDTNIYSLAMKGDAHIVNILRKIDLIGFTAISIGELFSGFKGGRREIKNREDLNLFLDSPRVVVHAVDEGSADFYASILNNLNRWHTNCLHVLGSKYSSAPQPFRRNFHLLT